jgi:predicted nucleic acid-binding protein
MKVLADTSVLIAAMVESHPGHERAFPWLRQAKQKRIELFVSNHTLAELYAVLTTLPVHPRLSPDTARRLIREDIESVAVIIDLRAADYRRVLDDMSALGLSGGVIYDALGARAARKAEVDRLITFNVADFRRVWPDAGGIVQAP